MDTRTITRWMFPALLVASQACGSTSPEPTATANWGGTYAVETSLDTYHYETGYEPVAECTDPAALYCEHYVTPPVGASLNATIHLAANVSGTVSATGSSTAVNCPSCLAGIGGLPSTADYPLGAGVFDASDSTFNADLASAATPTFLRLQLTNGTIRGDSIFGTVTWGYNCCRGPSYYTGTFIGHRVE